MSISNLIFTACVACKNQVQNRQKIKCRWIGGMPQKVINQLKTQNVKSQYHYQGMVIYKLLSTLLNKVVKLMWTRLKLIVQISYQKICGHVWMFMPKSTRILKLMNISNQLCHTNFLRENKLVYHSVLERI